MARERKRERVDVNLETWKRHEKSTWTLHTKVVQHCVVSPYDKKISSYDIAANAKGNIEKYLDIGGYKVHNK